MRVTQELGKSTLVKFIIDQLIGEFGIEEKDVVYCAFTGKACQVLQKKGNKNVSTLHKLLYKYYPRSDGTFVRMAKTELEYKIIVVDECSMMPMDMAKQLFSYNNIYVLCLGDPGQLPPIYADMDNHLLDSPHIFLDEIMRQAAESEIIQLSMKIRNGEKIDFFQGRDVQILPKDQLTTGMMMWADQIICATNATRISINNQMRELLGRSGNPQEGDKIICLKNYWNILSENEEPLVNGTIGTITNSFEDFFQTPKRLHIKQSKLEVISGNFESENGELYSSLKMDKKLFTAGEPSLDNKDIYKLGKNYKWMIPKEFTYGYAITGHKSQRK